MLRNQKVYYRFQKEPLIYPIPKSLQSSRTRPITTHCSSLRITLTLESHLSASFPSFRFLSDSHRKLLTQFSCFISVQNRTRLSSRFVHLHNVWQGLQIMLHIFKPCCPVYRM